MRSAACSLVLISEWSWALYNHSCSGISNLSRLDPISIMKSSLGDRPWISWVVVGPLPRFVQVVDFFFVLLCSSPLPVRSVSYKKSPTIHSGGGGWGYSSFSSRPTICSTWQKVFILKKTSAEVSEPHSRSQRVWRFWITLGRSSLGRMIPGAHLLKWDSGVTGPETYSPRRRTRKRWRDSLAIKICKNWWNFSSV